MHVPREPHINLVKQILRYIKGSLDLGLCLNAMPTVFLTTYFDADWASYTLVDPLFGYCVYLVVILRCGLPKDSRLFLALALRTHSLRGPSHLLEGSGGVLLASCHEGGGERDLLWVR
jgi:hypothetical protein